MSNTDRAFIKAYAREQGLARHAPPTMTRGQEPAPHVSAAADSDPYAATVSIVTKAVVAPVSSKPPTAPPQRSSGRVPAPHFSLAGNDRQQRKHQQRARLQAAAPPAARRANVAPLSAYTSAAQVAPPVTRVSLEPALEVAGFVWPERCEQLLAQAGDAIDQLAARIESAAPQKLLAICGLFRGEGCTSLLLTLARKLAERNVRTAIVDADWRRPRVAGELGLSISTGWEDVLAGRLALAETLIYSQGDRLSLLPVAQPQNEVALLIDSVRMPVSIAQLLEQYDRVLVDTGPLLAQGATAIDFLGRCRNAAALVVRDCRGAIQHELASATRALADAGVAVLGVAETFAAPIVRKSRTEAALSAAAM